MGELCPRPAYLELALMFRDTDLVKLSPLLSIVDNHAKWIVVRQGSYPSDIDGIRIVRAADFFLQRHKRGAN